MDVCVLERSLIKAKRGRHLDLSVIVRYTGISFVSFNYIQSRIS